MTNHWIDLKNSDVVLIMGSNAAENHPISFKWVMKAKEAGGKIIHVDPRFTRTSTKADIYAPLRSGTDIAFLGGMIKYILDNNLYQKDYVLNYTNASFIVGKDFAFKDGLFAGFNPETNKYDKTKWAFEIRGGLGQEGRHAAERALRLPAAQEPLRPVRHEDRFGRNRNAFG
jgi:formate dehydrogenase major subunit